MREYAICPYCKGSGLPPDYLDDWYLFARPGSVHQCRPCLGSGLTFAEQTQTFFVEQMRLKDRIAELERSFMELAKFRFDVEVGRW